MAIRKTRLLSAAAVSGVLILGVLVWISARAIGQQAADPEQSPHVDSPVGDSPRLDRVELADDPNQHFLQDVLDHEEALLTVTRTLLRRDLTDAVRERIFGLDVEHAAKAERASEILKTSHSIEWKPAVRPEYHGSIAKALAGQPTHTAADFSDFLKRHQSQEAALVDSFLPLLTETDVIRVARQMGASRGSKAPLLPR